MSYFDAYKARVSPNGESMQDSTLSSAKRKAANDIMRSPTLSYVKLNDGLSDVPVIISDKETFHKRTFLFIPDTVINVGDYIRQQDGAIYLSINQKKNDIYPQLIGELCNEVFIMKTEPTRVTIGYDDFKRPIYRDIGSKDIPIPCVATDKIYSTIDNSAIPLPDGALMIRIPYDVNLIPKVNYIFNQRGREFKVNTISYDNVIDEIGYLEIRLQSET